MHSLVNSYTATTLAQHMQSQQYVCTQGMVTTQLALHITTLSKHTACCKHSLQAMSHTLRYIHRSPREHALSRHGGIHSSESDSKDHAPINTDLQLLLSFFSGLLQCLAVQVGIIHLFLLSNNLLLQLISHLHAGFQALLHLLTFLQTPLAHHWGVRHCRGMHLHSYARAACWPPKADPGLKTTPALRPSLAALGPRHAHDITDAHTTRWADLGAL